VGKLEGRGGYRLGIVAGASRMMLAGRASEQQALPALLPLLYAALSTSDCPEGLVSDHGTVFRAGASLALLKALEVEPTDLELRKPWHNLMEAPFKVPWRLAAFPCAQASPVEDRQQ